MATSTTEQDEKYDVFLVHSSEDNGTADTINTALNEMGLKTFAHYKEGVEFPAGRPVFDNILHAVKQSKIVLVLLTQNAIKSQWVTFEILMGLEKSHREDEMCVRLVFEGISEKEREEFKKGSLDAIPDVVLDFNKESWKQTLVDKINERVKMQELLPAGNVAHGLVFNYFIGYLTHVLPVMADAIEKYKIKHIQQGKFSQKFFLFLPESCEIKPLEGRYGEFTIEKMGTPLEVIKTHGDKQRKYYPLVYRILKDGSDESFYFTGDIPFIVATMSKMNNMGFVEIDLNSQMVRFKMTLMELVQHRENLECKDTAKFISYKDVDESLADMIWKNIMEELTTKVPKGETAESKTVTRKKAEYKAGENEITATITHMGEGKDRATAEEIVTFLGDEERNVKFHNGEGKMNFEVLANARWNIFVLSEDALEDDTMVAQYLAALEYSICDNEVQVIPVLASGTDIKKIPDLMKWTTLLKEDEPEYLNKLWKFMNEKRTMMELIPSGKIYEGLAYAYLINYLPYNLTRKTPEGRDFTQRFIDAKEKYKIKEPCVNKVYVIVPKSCSFPDAGSSIKNEEHIGPLEPIVDGFRQYCLQLYRLTMSNGEKVCYAREYATPAIALHDMAQKPFAGVSKEAMNEQAKKFAEFSEEIMKNKIFNDKIGDVRDKCEMVYFDDESTGMDGVIDVLEERLKKCLDTGSYV
ncbi:uncharacterized protein LOC132756179 [Ruditapes philippinarum]|uniref:uncharacterized protein LOC132756179 n=1 Tax=Ruditapes philippinarum TaxID=129788 RepID=UPI00295BA4B9|nr:uncharacterized protein LOC132756179 [Ruditapes philippinarum]XP_060603165.1 uncharacterized protein LOC132756179 [Ruditapes philippinarum]XP_060603166.1 uncharacterized protein LOC132756179 [Ruditapes philippinarum]XP_060603167.1 uncharacterized protein LOC132756179 [Ruditapes philippinarum]